MDESKALKGLEVNRSRHLEMFAIAARHAVVLAEAPAGVELRQLGRDVKDAIGFEAVEVAVGLVDELANDADLGMGLEHLELERGRAVGQQRRCRSILAGRDVRHGFADCGEGGGAARVCGTTEGARARLHCEGLGGPVGATLQNCTLEMLTAMFRALPEESTWVTNSRCCGPRRRSVAHKRDGRYDLLVRPCTLEPIAERR